MISNQFQFQNLKRIKGIIFDLDGTLTVPCMNFQILRERLGISQGIDVLREIKKWDTVENKRAHKIIYEFELEARNIMQIQSGTINLLEFMEQNKLLKAIHSRNSLENIKYFVDHVKPYKFDHLVGRDESVEPKPHPSGSHEISKNLNLQPDQFLFVGDSIDDVTTSKSFGSISCLLLNETNRKHATSADFSVESFTELQNLLREHLVCNNTSSINVNSKQ
ncbi:hypothetical protein DLAC_00435 [Tieghemostelium lacteum]|uniref:Uncharacterized protein n=1 Tax=Tieghemostelium lacteum TaxID=361077 RepID=A0A152A9Q0_TIELA|nr:hypothetical protein DLAC_00435 [Tieghemostelium lacteum]|eukprot:KYR02952.1 hypothetical protein DLAC_00435 [Tieghemostelium lacteum]